MSKWTVFIEYLELDQKQYCLEYDNHRIANITKEQFEDFERLLSKAPEQPPAGDFTKKVRKDWDKNIFGGVIFDLCDRLDRSEASREALLTVCKFTKAHIKKGSQKKALPILRAAIAKAKKESGE